MKKQIPVTETSPAVPPVPRNETQELMAIYEQSREAIEFHSHPERMTPAELFDIDDL